MKQHRCHSRTFRESSCVSRARAAATPASQAGAIGAARCPLTRTNGGRLEYGDYGELSIDSCGRNHVVWARGRATADPPSTRSVPLDDPLPRLGPSRDPRRHDEHLAVAKLDGPPGRVMTLQSELVHAVEDEGGVLVGGK